MDILSASLARLVVRRGTDWGSAGLRVTRKLRGARGPARASRRLARAASTDAGLLRVRGNLGTDHDLTLWMQYRQAKVDPAATREGPRLI